ncbi:hypothetical protein SLA2020_365100 [Shorea laevis]
MSIISWNCRGLGNPRTVRDLCQLVKDKQPQFLFLMETKLRQFRMQVIRLKLRYEGMLVVDPIGRSGGLALLWREAHDLEIQNYSLRHINAIVHTGDPRGSWKLTCFYGHPDRAQRFESWNLLSFLKRFNPEPWLCIGDFNEIVDQSEKVGGSIRSEWQMESFRTALDECQLGDLGYRGSRFTWTNCREVDHFIKERLDRATATTSWCAKFPSVDVNILAARRSDHKPLYVSFLGNGHQRSRRKVFKYEASWGADEECADLVKHVWVQPDSGTSPVQSAQHLLQQCQKTLSSGAPQSFAILGKF